EACGTAHFWGRELQAMGHQVRLLPPHTVRPYVQRSKTDRADAEALLEAARNDAICNVPGKSVAQQNIMALHALRAAWRETLTARYNLARSVLRELGFAVPVGAAFVVGAVRRLAVDGSLPAAVQGSLSSVCEEIESLKERIDEIE